MYKDAHNEDLRCFYLYEKDEPKGSKNQLH